MTVGDMPDNDLAIYWKKIDTAYENYEAHRPDGTYMQVSESVGSTADRPMWDVFVRTDSGCCEYLSGEHEDTTVMDLMVTAEDVHLPDDATGSDGCDTEHVVTA